MTDQPNRDSILANLGKLRESTEKAAAVEADYAPAFTPKTIQPKPTTFRKGGLMEQAEDASTSEQSKELTAFIDSLPMMEVVKNWGKPQKEYKSVGPTSVLIRCPKPEHPDNTPSASLELVEGLYHCHACAEGGDRYTMAALHYGTTTNSKDFVELKEKMALDLGYTITQSGGQKMVQAPAHSAPTPVMPSNPAPSQIVKLDDGSYLDQSTGELVDTPVRPQPVQLTGGVFGANAVVQPTPQPVVFEEEEDEEEEVEADTIFARSQPVLDWKPLGRNGSFIDAYMACTESRRDPETLSFAVAMMCASFVGGRNVYLDLEDPLYANFGMIMVAGSGVGKSRSFRKAEEVMGEVFPFRDAELAIGMTSQLVESSGVKFVTGSGSGENMVTQFENRVQVGSTADGKPEYAHSPVHGIISFDEFATYVSKATNQSSTVRERIQGFLDGQPRLRSDTQTHGDHMAYRPYACMHMGVQPARLHELMTKSDVTSGLLNRFMFFSGTKKPRQKGRLQRTDMTRAVKALKDLKEFWDAQGTVIIDDRPVEDELHEYLTKNVDPVQEHPDKPMFGRLEVLLYKSILLICLNEKSTVVTPDILGKAIHLHKYLIEMFNYVSEEMYDPITAPDTDSIERRIVKRIMEKTAERKAQGKETPEQYAITPTQIRSGGLRRKLDDHPQGGAKALSMALDALVKIGDIKEVRTSRATKYYIK